MKKENYTYRVRNVENQMDIRTTHLRHVKKIITNTDLDKVNKALNNEHKKNEPHQNKNVDPLHMRLRPRNIH